MVHLTPVAKVVAYIKPRNESGIEWMRCVATVCHYEYSIGYSNCIAVQPKVKELSYVSKMFDQLRIYHSLMQAK